MFSIRSNVGQYQREGIYEVVNSVLALKSYSTWKQAGGTG
ncbi:hypothetical protein SDJN03_15580, partial [Cucurbita argyrosperma subsp. sororia]